MPRTRTVPTLELVRDALVPALERTRAQKAIVFGSVATGKADAYSDIDLIVVARSELPFVERFKDFRGVLEAAGRAIDLLVYTPEELAQIVAEDNPFIVPALAEGAVIFERPVREAGVAPPMPGEWTPFPERMLLMAESHLGSARFATLKGFHSQACFTSWLACECALKAVAYLAHRSINRTTSILELLDGVAPDYPSLRALRVTAVQLDPYYLTARYPDPRGDGIPATSIGSEQATSAVPKPQRSAPKPDG